ncbi:MAG: NAD(P)/FAD-dependent oxidoreductase [Candidatus Polarisedimenticolia bacterium]
MDHETHVAIVGGGPAGSAAAIGLTARGLSVILMDKSPFPRDKICGDFLTPGSVEKLEAIAGDAIAKLRPCPLRGMKITFEQRAIESSFPFGKQGHGLTRRELDDVLRARAEESGARWMPSFTARGTTLERDGTRVVEGTWPDGTRGRVRARLVVEASGRHGPFGRALGWRRDDPRLRRFALWSHMQGVRDLRERGEMHVFEGGYVGVGARDVASGLANVTMVLTPRAMAQARGHVAEYFHGALARHPELGRRTQGAARISPVRGLGPLACTASRVASGRLALVGDASGFVDPFTGEGVFVALESARLLAASVVERDPGDPEGLRRYERAHASAFRSKLRLCRLLQITIARPWLARRVTRALSSRRDLAERMLGATGDILPAADVLNPGYLGRLLLAGIRA